MVRGFIANRISISGITGLQIGLTTAAAKIRFFLGAAPAGFFHPFKASVFIEGRRFVPYPLNTLFTHVRILDPGLQSGRMAWERGAIRSDDKEYRTPAVHARLRPRFVMIRYTNVIVLIYINKNFIKFYKFNEVIE